MKNPVLKIIIRELASGEHAESHLRRETIAGYSAHHCKDGSINVVIVKRGGEQLNLTNINSENLQLLEDFYYNYTNNDTTIVHTI